MSHFTVMVIGDNPEDQLMPYSENLDVDEYVVGTISDGDKGEFTEFYTVYDKDRKHGHVSKDQAEANKKMSFDDLYSKYGEDWNGGCWRKNKDGEWAEYSTYSPISKWDWYILGGRWSGMIKLKDNTDGVYGSPEVLDNEVGVDQANRGDIANFDEITTFAILKNGEWIESGEMMYFGMVANEKDDWDEIFKKETSNIPDDTLISIYDCHI